MSFGDDLLSNFVSDKFDVSGLPNTKEITEIKVIRNPSGYLDKDILRKVAIRNSVDGRWVQVEDYRNGVLREYGEYIDDLLVADEYPAEEMIILPKKIQWTTGIEDLIRELIDNKRGNATLVNIKYLDPYDDDRLDLTFNFIYQGPETSNEVQKIIDEYVKSKLNRIHYSGYWLVGADIAVDLTNVSKGKFYASLEDKFYIEPLQSVKSLELNFTR